MEKTFTIKEILNVLEQLASKKVYFNIQTYYGIKLAIQAIQNLSPQQISYKKESVKRAHWIVANDKTTIFCPVCRNDAINNIKTPFCPYCGSRMERVTENLK